MHIYIDESGLSTNDRVLVFTGVVVDPKRQYLKLQSEISGLIEEFVPAARKDNFAFHAKICFMALADRLSTGGRIRQSAHGKP